MAGAEEAVTGVAGLRGRARPGDVDGGKAEKAPRKRGGGHPSECADGALVAAGPARPGPGKGGRGGERGADTGTRRGFTRCVSLLNGQQQSGSWWRSKETSNACLPCLPGGCLFLVNRRVDTRAREPQRTRDCCSLVFTAACQKWEHVRSKPVFFGRDRSFAVERRGWATCSLALRGNAGSLSKGLVCHRPCNNNTCCC